jgi:hypothetical protein
MAFSPDCGVNLVLLKPLGIAAPWQVKHCFSKIPVVIRGLANYLVEYPTKGNLALQCFCQAFRKIMSRLCPLGFFGRPCVALPFSDGAKRILIFAC